MHGFPKKFELMMLLNTLKKYPKGFTYYDLQQFGRIPHSKIYRIMKRFEKSGILRKEEIQESGRPKHLFFYTENAEKLRNDIAGQIKDYFEYLSRQQFQTNFDYDDFVNNGTLDLWKSPLDRLLKADHVPIEEKIEILKSMEEDMANVVRDIKKNIRKLEKELKREDDLK